MEFKYTKYQVARGSRPDFETFDKIILIKKASEMRATYQIKLLTYLALKKNKKLILEVPKECKIHKSLCVFKKENPKIIKIKRA